jgi:hypothetical protein
VSAHARGDASHDVSGAIARHPPSAAASAPADVQPRLDRASDPTPVAFVQRDGDAYVHWSVVEVDVGALPGARGPRCLLFTRQDCIRRVWDYPADWRTLDAAALAALSWNQ